MSICITTQRSRSVIDYTKSMPMKFDSPEDRRLYNRRHGLVNKRRGKAAEQTCSCGDQARVWAHTHDSDPDDVLNYTAMCFRCHHEYDRGTMYGSERNRRVAEASRRMWSEADEDKRSRMAGNATGKRSPEAVSNIKAGSIRRYQTDNGKNRAYRERTPEQRKRIRQGRWGGDAR